MRSWIGWSGRPGHLSYPGGRQADTGLTISGALQIRLPREMTGDCKPETPIGRPVSSSPDRPLFTEHEERNIDHTTGRPRSGSSGWRQEYRNQSITAIVGTFQESRPDETYLPTASMNYTVQIPCGQQGFYRGTFCPTCFRDGADRNILLKVLPDQEGLNILDQNM
ncbi:MAG: hypothetical protein GX885_03110 [Methanomicrobiales archaeon]|nr:hypothetical protein [Methanomicrobiales archaeon]